MPVSQITFNQADIKFRLSRATDMRKVLRRIFKDAGKSLAGLTCVFSSDDYLLEINREFLKHNEFTDIITFDFSAGPGITGEIYISVDRVRDNALIHNVSFRHELSRVIFHGALHLVGLSDKTERGRKEMRKMEEKYLALLG
ncbi:MAG TPA: rRNA maturation RNase YbeY [Chitinophagaceae bacterium]